jgi:hypothetical protein
LIKSAIKYWREVAEAYGNLEQTDKLLGRAFNYWAPVLAICKVFAPEHYEGLLSLAEEEAERMEKGDLLSDVEDAVLTVLLEEANRSDQITITLPLKELTERATEICPMIKSWHVVKSAVTNLRIMRRKPYSQSGKGVVYQLDLMKAKAIAEERGIVLELETTKQPETSTTPLVPEPTLIIENIEKVLEAIRREEALCVYATLPKLEFSTGIPQSDLKQILSIMEKEGRVFQFREGCYKLAK